MTRFSRSTKLSLACAAVLAAAGAALPASADQSTTVALEEITVTSRKREESLQDAPVSVTAFSSAALEARSLESFVDLNNYAPNIELSNGRVDGGGSVAQIFIRGVGQEDYSFPNDPGVGVYLDGVYVSRSSGGDFGFMDIQRVEVLRGPQGTLYGKNTIGGAINVITKKPNGSDSGEIELLYGEFNRVDLMASYDFAINADWSGKISGMSRSRDGYGDAINGQKLREENKDAARFQLRYAPEGSTFEGLFQAEFSEQRATGSMGAMRVFWPGDIANLVNAYGAAEVAAQYGLVAPFDVYGEAWVNRIDDTEDFTSGAGSETRDNNEIFGASLTLDWDLGGYAVKSITAYRQVEIDVQRDGDNTPFNVFTVAIDEKTEQVSQEIQVSGRALNDRLPWIFGIYGINETGYNSFIAPLIEDVYDAIGLDISLLTNTEIDTVSLAIFGEGTYYFTENFGLTLGGRFNRDDKEYTYQLDRIFSGVAAIPRITLDKTWDEFLPKVGVEYRLNPDVKLYATAAEGFKAGGWNPRTLTPGTEPQSFDPEYIRTYEIGAKTTLLDGRVTLNAAAFFSEYEDIQLIAVTTVELPDGTETVDTTINNAGEGEIQGAEIELSARPIEALTLNLGVGYLDTKYTDLGDDVIAAGTATLDSEFIQSPEWTVNFAIGYDIAMAGGGVLTLFGDMAYKSDIQRSVQNFEDLVTDAYTIVNGRVTYQPVSEKWQLSAFVTNITDEIYMTNGVDVRGLGATEAYYSRPREYGVSLKVRF